jgi:transcriptional regulator with XRE-family HTH domain
MSGKTIYDEFISDRENARLLAQASLILDATERIAEIMEEKKVNRSMLAQRLGKTKAFVTQVLHGTRNITLRTLADFLFALGYEARVKTVSFGARSETRTATACSICVSAEYRQEPVTGVFAGIPPHPVTTWTHTVGRGAGYGIQ